VGEKGGDFRDAHLGWMALSVEQDKALDPVGVGVFDPDGIVFETDGVAHVVKEFP
jgi:hypothetical protein